MLLWQGLFWLVLVLLLAMLSPLQVADSTFNSVQPHFSLYTSFVLTCSVMNSWLVKFKSYAGNVAKLAMASRSRSSEVFDAIFLGFVCTYCSFGNGTLHTQQDICPDALYDSRQSTQYLQPQGRAASSFSSRQIGHVFFC